MPVRQEYSEELKAQLKAEVDETVLTRLREIGRQRKLVLAELGEIEDALARAIAEADASGVPRLTIAREAGVARETVYKTLRRQQ